MMKPNISPIFRGSKLVPRTSPRPAIATHASGTNVRMIHQCSDRWAWTPGACTTDAMGSTMMADSTPWAAPESTFAIATSQMGHGASTRSSISRVKPNSWAIERAIDCTPWNMTEIPTTPGTRTVAKADSAAVPCPPMPCPIFGNTKRKTKQSRNGWMIVRSTNSQRQEPRVYDALAALVPPPAGVTREGILHGDRRMLDRWWDQLGLGDTGWWRHLQGKWQ